jgi:DNA repair protein RadA/Sms
VAGVKSKDVHVCRSCGTTALRWAGRCPGCGEWNSLEVRRVAEVAPVLEELRDVDVSGDPATPSGVSELDRVLGGGLVPGSTTLLFGEPGVGKSTLALSVLCAVAAAGHGALLIASEESAAQVARRARRLGPVPAGLGLVATTDVDEAVAALAHHPRVAVVDSVSALSDGGLTTAPGSVPQVRQAAERLCRVAKSTGTALILVGHVTKDGELAGPRALEHLVDTVVRVEGDRHGSLRLLRALKHRFGPTDEVGLLEMVAGGLREPPDDALGRRAALEVPGVVGTVTLDGSRSFVVEVQALVAAPTGTARRVAHLVSSQRLSLLLAVLDARCAVATGSLDVFASTAGGLAATEPGVDAALALAIASVVAGFAVSRSLVVVGEVGLAGELRAVVGLTRRVREARRVGATLVIAPVEGDLDEVADIDVVRCGSLIEAIEAARSASK